jgi:hypothetical protein
LSGGKPHYFGTVTGVGPHFESLGFPMPLHINPAEFVLELMNVDFVSHHHQAAARERLQDMQNAWLKSPRALETSAQIERTVQNAEPVPISKASRRNFPVILMTLVHRAFIKSYRDVVAYGIRMAMYTGLAIMMGTVWLRLHTDQSDIQPFINAIVSISAFAISFSKH